MNVLIVDDDEAMGLLLGATLRALAKRIEIAASFREGKEWLKKVPFNLVLLDIGLPDSPAWATVTRVSEMRETGAKVVIVTGFWPPNSIVTPETSGADDVIYKGDLGMLNKLKELASKSSTAVPA